MFEENMLSGGAIRSKKILESLEKVFQDIETVYVTSKSFHENNLPGFLDIEEDQVEDIRMLYRDYGVRDLIKNTPDLVIFDHPWLWQEAKSIKKMCPNIKIVHSSHNIEHHLKLKILQEMGISSSNKIAKIVKDAETFIARDADLIITTTDLDKDWFIKNNAKNVVCLKNGTDPVLSRTSIPDNFLTVVGSDHPPNIEGAIKYLKNAVDWLPENTSLFILGGMTNKLVNRLGPLKNEEKGTEIIMFPKISKEDLQNYLKSSNAILLPISYGGGSNLKTAEALASFRPIVSTSIAFGGYESFLNNENVYIQDSVEDFQKMCIKQLKQKSKDFDVANVENLFWDSITKQLPDKILSL
jgi:glycosyltransferase involved in cell wall biosynthesis